MAIKLRLSKKGFLGKLTATRWRRWLLGTTTFFLLLGGGVFFYFYNYYARQIEQQLEEGPFANMSVLYSAPRPLVKDEHIAAAEIAAYLRTAGYSQDTNRSPVGWYKLRPDGIDINPGPAAYDNEGAVIKVDKDVVTDIISQHDNRHRTEYLLEPVPLSNLDKQRQKRRIVRFQDIPKVMEDALLSAEDKNFRSHPGFDPFGILRAAYRDVVEGKMEGASTITQQLARTLWLGNERGWRRKIPETLLTLHLEHKLSKDQIFEYYANSIDIGRVGSFWVRGFAQGAQAYFGKDLRDITLPEAAMLAGMPQGPDRYDPFRHPEASTHRRNLVLTAMYNNGKITEKQLQEASAAPLGVKPEAADTSDAPYFVDLLQQTLGTQFPNKDLATTGYRIYTTLDPELQRDLVEAVRTRIPETDALWKRDKGYGVKHARAQVAAVVIDAETGEVLALQGGRSYGESQLNRVLAKRQPGSSFKPIVYAAAMATGLDASAANLFTPAYVVNDEETTFWFDDKPYEPRDHDKFKGLVTLRYALAHSLNIPAIKLAEKVGYNTVVDTARSMGLPYKDNFATPSIALGTYEVTPLDIARAYTVFVNNGQLVSTSLVRGIRSAGGEHVYQSKVEKKDAIDPRVAYLVQNMMQEVLRSGTGAGAGRYGFNLPAAGKTGTSRDAWFVGFTSRIICAVWVGFDDNKDFEFEGAKTALPIWADFMARAHKHREYSNVHTLPPPDGVVTVEVDADTGELATAACPKVRSEVFITGTQPLQLCHLHNRGGQTMVASFDPAPVERAEVRPKTDDPAPARVRRADAKPKVIPIEPSPKAPAEQPAEGLWGRIKGLFR